MSTPDIKLLINLKDNDKVKKDINLVYYNVSYNEYCIIDYVEEKQHMIYYSHNYKKNDKLKTVYSAMHKGSSFE